MGVMIHLAYKVANGGGVPSPVDGTPTTQWPLDEWADLMPLLARHGLTVAVCPPLTKGASLGAGYDVFDHYDLGSKNQRGRRETRYGSVETAMRFFAICRALGMQVYTNFVPHHLDGDNGDFNFHYVAADGTSMVGRFPKDRHCFTQVWPNPDGVPDASTDWAFGREFLWNSGFFGDGKGPNGPGYVRRGLTAALDWQTRRLGVDGYFIDDVKGTNAGCVGSLLTQRAMTGQVAFGEYSDGQTQNVMRWIHCPEMNGVCGALDFPLKYKLNNVLNNAGRADMRQLLSEGVLWTDPARAVTFLDNADSDLSSPVIWNKLLGYAMILTFPGYPMLFGKDLYKREGCYGLLDPVLNLVWIHETFAKGDLVWRSLAYNHLVYERMGDITSSGILVGVNNEPGSFANPADWRPVRVQSKWRNTLLHDYVGHSYDQWTDADGFVTIWLPPNDNGKGFVVFAPAGIENPIHLVPRHTSQTFFCADDLDIPNARNGRLTLGRIYVEKGSSLSATIHVYEPVAGASVEPIFVDADGTVVTHADAKGFYTVMVASDGLPPLGVKCEIKVTYMAPTTI